LLTDEDDKGSAKLIIAAVVPFQNEAQHLPTLLRSLAAQTRVPDELVLVDDGSTDESAQIASDATAIDWIELLRLPPRPPARDRLATAAELVAFHRGLEQVHTAWDVVVKLDADVDLSPQTFATLERAFVEDPRLGLAGAYLSLRGPDGVARREPNPESHVRGSTKFYRRACYEQIGPLPAHLGWDTMDEYAARMHGWRTKSIEIPGGDPIHLRPLGQHDGRFQAFRRWGVCAWGYGEHPLHVLLVGLRMTRERPYVLSGAGYVLGWIGAGMRRAPRAERGLRAYIQADQLARIRRRLGRLGRSSARGVR